MKTLIYVAIYALILQFIPDRVVPLDWVHHYRIEYPVIKNNMAANLNLAMARAAREIRLNPQQEYVILLGDSVTYSGPGTPEESIGHYLEQWSRERGRPLRVYNFAQPGMMGADTYAQVLMLAEHRIPLDRVVINQVYSHFAPRPPGEPIFGWLGDELYRLDRAAWQLAGGTQAHVPPLTRWVRERAVGWNKIWQYRDILRTHLNRFDPVAAPGEVRDVRPWYQKREALEQQMDNIMYQRFVDPRPLDLGPGSAHAQMLERTVDRLQGARVLFWFSPVNHALLGKWTDKPGYRANRNRIDAWFEARPVTYLNLEHAVASDLFTDHVHLLPEGYRQVAATLGARLLEMERR